MKIGGKKKTEKKSASIFLEMPGPVSRALRVLSILMCSFTALRSGSYHSLQVEAEPVSLHRPDNTTLTILQKRALLCLPIHQGLGTQSNQPTQKQSYKKKRFDQVPKPCVTRCSSSEWSWYTVGTAVNSSLQPITSWYKGMLFLNSKHKG